MSDRDPRRPIVPEPEDERFDPIDRRGRADVPSRPTAGRPIGDGSGLRRSSSFPWLTDGTDSARLIDDRSTTGGADDRGTARAPVGHAARSAPPVDDPTDPAAWAEVTEAWAADTDEGWDERQGITGRAAAEPVIAERRVPEPEIVSSRRTVRGARAPAAARPRTETRAASTRPALALPTVRLPAGLASAGLLGDRTALALLGASLLSAATMALVLSSQVPNLPPSLTLHLDAAGLADRFGPPRVLWRLPLLAAMATLLNLVLAWFLARADRFAARFLLAATLVVHLIAWVALFDFV